MSKIMKKFENRMFLKIVKNKKLFMLYSKFTLVLWVLYIVFKKY